MSHGFTNTHSIEEAWSVVADLYCQATPDSASRYPPEVHEELLFCLLGGFGISYELGKSAAGIIQGMRPFSTDWSDRDLFREIIRTLSLAQFEPPRTNGSLRRYRFPNQKATAIVQARQWVLSNDPLHERLRMLPSPKDRRELLIGCPGVGYKTASWVLRNTGLGNDLAILDVHVMRALADAKRISREARIPQDYETVEVAFLNWCEELDAPSAAFDLFLWHWQRGSLRII